MRTSFKVVAFLLLVGIGAIGVIKHLELDLERRADAARLGYEVGCYDFAIATCQVSTRPGLCVSLAVENCPLSAVKYRNWLFPTKK
jgi:hypothetical protein